MSRCISREGEYSDHKVSDDDYTCDRCFDFDDEAALREIERLRKQMDAVQDELSEWDTAVNKDGSPAIMPVHGGAALIRAAIARATS